MIVDCDSCEVRGAACGECVIGVLLGMPGVRGTAGEPGSTGERSAGPPSGAPQLQLDAAERRALAVLADQGLVPRLRVVPGSSRGITDIGGGPAEHRDVG